MGASRNTRKTIPARNTPNPLPVEGGQTTDGEMGGVGSTYTAVLNERQNKSIRGTNIGPDRPSANTSMIPNVDDSVRKTGRVLGRGMAMANKNRKFLGNFNDTAAPDASSTQEETTQVAPQAEAPAPDFEAEAAAALKEFQAAQALAKKAGQAPAPAPTTAPAPAPQQVQQPQQSQQTEAQIEALRREIEQMKADAEFNIRQGELNTYRLSIINAAMQRGDSVIEELVYGSSEAELDATLDASIKRHKAIAASALAAAQRAGGVQVARTAPVAGRPPAPAARSPEPPPAAAAPSTPSNLNAPAPVETQEVDISELLTAESIRNGAYAKNREAIHRHLREQIRGAQSGTAPTQVTLQPYNPPQSPQRSLMAGVSIPHITPTVQRTQPQGNFIAQSGVRSPTAAPVPAPPQTSTPPQPGNAANGFDVAAARAAAQAASSAGSTSIQQITQQRYGNQQLGRSQNAFVNHHSISIGAWIHRAPPVSSRRLRG